MKKQVLIGSVLLAAMSTFSQTGSRIAKPVGMINAKLIADMKFGNESAPVTKASPVKPTAFPNNSGSRTTSNTWMSLTASMNIYGVIISFTKPLQWNDELNAVSFVHRKSPSYLVSPPPASTAENGNMVAEISKDYGTTWDSTAIYTNNTFWGRYPNGAISNPIQGNTSLSNAYIVGAGPTTGASASTWIGNWYASKKLDTFDNIPSTTPGAQQAMPTAGPFAAGFPSRHDFSAYNFSATDDGKVRILAGVTDDATQADTAVMMVTGEFNSGTGTYDWAGKVFDINKVTTMASDGTFNFTSRPMQAWNEQGTVGYVVVMGQRLGTTGSNTGLQPIVYKTINSGGAWSLEVGINFNSEDFSDVRAGIWPINADPSLNVPNFMWLESFDVSVDADNKLHIFSTVAGQSSNHPDSMSFISQWNANEKYLWPHAPIVDGGEPIHPFMYDFVYDGTNASPTWTHFLVDAMSSEGPSGLAAGGGYQDNPWDMDASQSNQKVRIDARLQMSRTPDGKFLLYTWTESDTAFTDQQKKWNNLPNIKARLYDVEKKKLSPTEINITEAADGEIANRAMYHCVSPKFRLDAKDTWNADVTVPMTISNSNPYSQLTANTHWYSAVNMRFELSTVGIKEQDGLLAANSSVFPNPAKNNATVKVNLNSTTKVQVQVLNTVGQVVKTVSAQGQAGSNSINVDLGGLASGIYLVSIKADNASSTKKLVIE